MVQMLRVFRKWSRDSDDTTSVLNGFATINQRFCNDTITFDEMEKLRKWVKTWNVNKKPVGTNLRA